MLHIRSLSSDLDSVDFYHSQPASQGGLTIYNSLEVTILNEIEKNLFGGFEKMRPRFGVHLF